jgi:hypothetical protein
MWLKCMTPIHKMGVIFHIAFVDNFTYNHSNEKQNDLRQGNDLEKK